MAKTKTKSWPKWPMKKDENTIKKLLDWFRSDFTISEACSCAWITTQTYYNRIEKDKQLLDDITSAKAYCFAMAKNNVRKWLNEWDKEYSLKRLKNRQNKIYSERSVDEIEWEVIHTISEEQKKALLSRLALDE